MTMKSTMADAPDRGRHAVLLEEHLPRRRLGITQEPTGRRTGRGDRPPVVEGRPVHRGCRVAGHEVPAAGVRSPFLRRGGGALEPLRLPRDRQALRVAADLPHLRPGPLHRPLPQGPLGRTARPAARAQEAWAGLGRHRRRPGRPHPPGAGRVAVPRRGVTQGLGPALPSGHPHGVGAGPAADAGAPPQGPPPGRPPARP
jgi:hypothetical protein